MTRHNVSTERVASMADWLGVASADEADHFADRIESLLAVYDPLEDVGRAREDRSWYTLEDVDFDPPPDDDPHNAFITRFEMAADGSGGPLSGMDVAVKDNVAVAGVPMTCGSRVLAGATPQENAAVVERLLRGGARLLGKTNQSEFALGPTGEHSGYGPARNPVSPEHVAGGSSSGSAAAVAEGSVDAALGSDTGGSIRVPAALCGVVGFKPTWGAVPRFGFVELAWTLDHVGPLARDVETAARVFDAIAGPDPRDDATLRADPIPVGECASLVDDAPGIGDYSVAVLDEHLGDGVDDDVRSRVRERIDRIEDAGAAVDRVSIPAAERAHSLTNAILVTEFAASFLHRGAPIGRREPVDPAWHGAASAALRARGDRLGDLVRTKAIEGTYLIQHRDARDYARARNASARLADEVDAVFEEYDLVAGPTVPRTAPELGAVESGSADSDASDWALDLVSNTRLANLAGCPAITVPCGSVGGLPVGLQFVGPAGDDATVLQAGRAFERLEAA